MKRFIGKLGFIHRRLWQQDGNYRIALLLGPAPCLGLSIAAVIWGSFTAVKQFTYQPPSWATAPHRAMWQTGTDQAAVLEPARPLPAFAADGSLEGIEPGWNVAIRPITVSPTMNVDVKTTSVATFNITGATIDMEQILAARSKEPLYVAVGTGFFIVKDGGTYTLSARFERVFAPTANCIVRLGFGKNRIISNVTVNVSNAVSKDYDAASFVLRPGLYPIAWGFGCWHGLKVIGPGRMTLLVVHPGGKALEPARPDELVR
ncbi:hypothetical protein [Rhodopila sp.]|uniref:hypothetical protein n=1 Tax=Rhodopila sp. TaxID=2480087 RepID=UPI003D0A3D4D